MPADKSDQVFLEAAVRHQLLTEAQVSTVTEIVRDTENSTAQQIAIREGFLNVRHLDALRCLESPKDVAPGYVVQKILGTGGFGNVFMAQQLNLSRTVAIKTIQLSQLSDPTSRKRFEREAKIVGQLRHPNIVTAFDFGLHHERLFLSMEYVQGLDADHLVERHGPLPAEVTWQIIKQVSMALTYAAEQDVIHRDIKPGNLLLTQAPTGYHLPDQIPLVKVADFGLACFSETSLLNSKLTAEHSAVGTPYYVAPEQLADSEVDVRADIYSLGITAWQLIVGKPPMHNLAPMKIVMKKLGGDEAWLEDLPESLSGPSGELIRSMCAHDPDQRIGDHHQLLQRIEDVIDSLSQAETSGQVRLGETRTMDLTSLIRSAEATNESFITQHSFDDVTQEFSSTEMAASQTPPATVNAAGPNSKPWKTKIALAAIGVLLLGIGWLALTQPGLFSFAIDLNTLPRLDRHNVPLYLFTGTDIPPRQTASGVWRLDADRDQGRVLAGNGTRHFECNNLEGLPLKYFQFSCGFRHHEAKRIEFQIEWKTERQIVMVELEDAYWKTPSNVTDNKLKAELQKFGSESLGYHQISIERQPGYVLAMIDGMPLGRVPFAEPEKDLPEEEQVPAIVTINVLGTGTAHFEQVYLRELLEDPPISEGAEQPSSTQ